MNPKAVGEAGAVVATAPLTAWVSGIPAAFVSVGVGLVGVWLARMIFVNRENRRLHRRQPLHETAPVTGVAMLIVAVVIYDRNLGLSGAAFLGLGVGWTTVLLLDIIGDRVVRSLKAFAGQDISAPAKRCDVSGHDGELDDVMQETPPDIAHLVDRADEVSRKD